VREGSNRQSSSTLISLAVCMALQMTSLVMLQPLFALRFESLGAGVQALGTSVMAYALTSAIAAPFIGMLADRFGRRPVILVSLAAYGLAFTGYLFAASARELILLRGLSGVLTAGLIPAVTSTVGDTAPETGRSQWIGIVNGGASAGWIVGPLLGGLLQDLYGYVVPFATAIALVVCTLLVAVLTVPETHKYTSRSDLPQIGWKKGWQSLTDRSTLTLLMVVIFGVMFAWAFIEPQFMFYVYDDLHWSSSQLGLVMSAYGVAFMLGEFGLGQLSDHAGRKPVLVLGLALFSAQFLGLVLFRDASWIMVSFILAGLGNALYDPALNAMILDIIPPGQTARMIGIKSTAGSLGNLLGPGLAVMIATLMNPKGIFLSAAGLTMALLLCTVLFVHRKETINVTQESSGAAL
jgi:predicted MFS family arabinose efflux permease